MLNINWGRTTRLKSSLITRVCFAVCIAYSMILTLYYTISTTVATDKSKRTDRINFVERYNFSNNHLEPTGHLSKHDETLGFPVRDRHTVLKLGGTEKLLHQKKSETLFDPKRFKATLPYEQFFRVNRNVKAVNCNKLFKGDKNETHRAKKRHYNWSEYINPVKYIKMTTNCSKFVKSRSYILSSLTKVEEQFPIAFSILMYKDVWQFERLLRAIYRPQNLYCLHVDSKQYAVNYTMRKAVIGISKCFENVFLASKQYDVQWGEMSVLEPELTCMQDLWNRSKSWKYFINLTGQEFPLRTNYELVQILTAYNGANDVAGSIKRVRKDRFLKAGPPPHGLTVVKGSVHVAVSRGYVDSVLHDPKIADLLNWTRNTLVPDETFFTMINHNPSLNVPGSYRGLLEKDPIEKPFAARYKNWSGPCDGFRFREICIFGIGDLPTLKTRREMFANKFYFNYGFALDCMEELHFNNTRDEYLGKVVFDPMWYSTLGFVHNRVDSLPIQTQDPIIRT